MEKVHKEPSEEATKPPIFKSWRHFYIFVLTFHALVIALFYWFTLAYA